MCIRDRYYSYIVRLGVLDVSTGVSDVLHIKLFFLYDIQVCRMSTGRKKGLMWRTHLTP